MKSCPQCGTRYANTSRICAHDGEMLEATDPEPGEVVGGRYRLEQMIGKGGMGVVYRAVHTALDREVALKFLRGHLAEDPVVLRRFQREAKAASGIRHDGIVDVTDFGEDPEHGVYYTMDFVPGSTSLEGPLAHGALPMDEVIRIGSEVADALHAAHEAGVTHRDLKPDNILLAARSGKRPQPKILDFGIAGVADDSNEQLTQTGTVFGTPLYMSPEQCAGQKVDRRSDIYSLGVILYQMATGGVPFQADNTLGLLVAHRTKPPEPPSARNAEVTPALQAVILRCMAKTADARFATMAQVRDALRGDATAPPAPVFDASMDETILPGTEPPMPGAAVSAPPASMPPPSVPAMTTTGLTHGEISAPSEPAAASRRGLLLPVGAVVVVGLVAAGYFLRPSGPEPKPAPPQPKAAAHVPAPTYITVRVVSTPSAAEVRDGEVVLGKTPLHLKLEKGEIRRVTVHAAGYTASEIAVDGITPRDYEVTLAAIPDAAPPPPPDAAVAQAPDAAVVVKKKKRRWRPRKKKDKGSTGRALLGIE